MLVSKLKLMLVLGVNCTSIDQCQDVNVCRDADAGYEQAQNPVRIVSQHYKYQGVKELHMLARIGCCNIMVFSPFKVKVTYYHPLNL